jgi:FkbH-like protein
MVEAEVACCLAGALEVRTEQLVKTWEDLGEAGPTFASADAGPAEQARARYLRPLARLLIGGLRGSADHAAVYLDERLRYVDQALAGAERSRLLEDVIGAEILDLAALAQPTVAAADAAAVLRSFHAHLFDPPEDPVKVLFIGDCLFVETRAFLLPAARALGAPVEVRQIFFSARQSIDEPNAAIRSAIEAHEPDVIGVSLFTFEGVPPYAAAWRQAAFGLRRRNARLIGGLTAMLGEAIEDIRAVSDATIVVHAPGGIPLHPLRRRAGILPAQSRAQRALLADLREAIGGPNGLVHGTKNTMLLDEWETVAAAGGPRTAAGPLFDEADVPSGYAHTTAFGPRLADRYAEIVADFRTVGRAKALFVDFDNTLWAGVMADGDVVHDADAQRLLLELKQAGVLLIALSKNAVENIRWDECLLKPEDFVLLKVNWRPKPDNVAQAISELDLAASAFVLLDDNPAERALVTENVPGVRALDPAEPSTWRTLRNWLEFPSTTQTAEAARRTELYREAATRRSALSNGHDYAEMMASLRLRHEVRPATAADHERALELAQRTNQFNTTTRRWSAAEIEGFLADPGVGLYVATLKDRFGDLGVVALVVFSRSTRTFDSVVMSCRAMGFGLEVALMRQVMEAEGPGSFTGLFEATERNSPARDLFERCGFSALDAAATTWHFDASGSLPDAPSWLRS